MTTNRTVTMTKEQAVSALNNLESAFPGGTRTEYSYRVDHFPGAGGVVAMTVYAHGKGYRIVHAA